MTDQTKSSRATLVIEFASPAALIAWLKQAKAALLVVPDTEVCFAPITIDVTPAEWALKHKDK